MVPRRLVSMPLRIRNRTYGPAATPIVMGVLNVTPDSFSDGGRFQPLDAAVTRALEMIDEGAGIIDIGPESTRPGASPVPEAAQIDRAVPVIEAIRERNGEIPISIDTTRAAVARAGLAAGADMVNDISALRDDPDMAKVVADAGIPIVLMHMRGTPADMQRHGGPPYDDLIGDIGAFLDERREAAVASGIEPSQIVFDPGIGFGKRLEHNLIILRDLDRIVRLGQPVAIGASRKSFIGQVLGISDPSRRDAGSVACAALAVAAGAAIVRAHEIRATAEVVRIAAAVRRVGDPASPNRTSTR